MVLVADLQEGQGQAARPVISQVWLWVITAKVRPAIVVSRLTMVAVTAGLGFPPGPTGLTGPVSHGPRGGVAAETPVARVT